MVAFVLSGVAQSQVPAPPSFDSYSVAGVYRGAVKPPNFGPLSQYHGSDLRCFEGRPEDYAAEHVNFAGHFVIGVCTCGTGCHSLFMWDAESGKFYHDLGFGAILVRPYESGRGPGAILRPSGEEYRVNSTLLILDGCFSETCDCAKRYYVWRGERFNLLLRQPDPLPAPCRSGSAEPRPK